MTSLGPRPKPTPVRIASSITRVILEAICAGVGLGLGLRLQNDLHPRNNGNRTNDLGMDCVD